MKRFIRFLFDFVRAYTATLIAVGVAIPIMAAVITVGIYIIDPQVTTLQQKGTQLPPDLLLHILGLGLLITLVIWLGSALCCIYLATAPGANMHSYSKIINELNRLKARLGIKDDLAEMSILEMQQAMGITPTPTTHVGEQCQSEIALREAHNYYHAVHTDLFGSSNRLSLRTGLRWVLGTGYISVWSMLHMTDEALFEVEGEATVIHGALNDYLSIQDSNIDNRDKLLSKLIQAVKELDPKAMIYFSEHQPGSNQDIVLEQLALIAKELHELSEASSSTSSPSVKAHTGKTGADETEDEGEEDTPVVHVSLASKAKARVTLRSVRHALNEFRDNRWEGLVRSRNQLLGTIALTGFITYLLLAILILGSISKSILIAATTFYTVGAVAGLFGRLYRESGNSTSIDDYGLAITRLLATPLLSGLAGVSGVFIAVTVYVDAANPALAYGTSLTQYFSLNSSYLLLVAAIFGLTPNLIIKSLQQQAEKYKSDIESSNIPDQSNGNA